MTAQGPPAGRPVHGGVKPEELRALGLNPEYVLDFSASVSPIGPPEGVWEALRKVDLGAYPDPHCLVLREELSARLSRGREVPLTVPIDNILVGNGSTEIIHLLARVFLSGESFAGNLSALQLSPTYGEYAGACGLMGVAISDFQAPSSPPFPVGHGRGGVPHWKKGSGPDWCSYATPIIPPASTWTRPM